MAVPWGPESAGNGGATTDEARRKGSDRTAVKHAFGPCGQTSVSPVLFDFQVALFAGCLTAGTAYLHRLPLTATLFVGLTRGSVLHTITFNLSTSRNASARETKMAS